VIRRGPLLLAALAVGCAGEPPIELEGLPFAGAGPIVPVVASPMLRSPFAGSERVTSHVTHTDGEGGLVDHACDAITRAGHRGTDFGVPVGTPIHASAAGRVIRRADGCSVGSSSCGGGFGNHVMILHAGGRATLYAHLKSGSDIPALDAEVLCGERIGESGNTGRSTGPHLHYEVRDGVRDANQYFSATVVDPFGGSCSSQTAALWMDGTPGGTCDGEEAPPRDGATVVSATHPRGVDARPGAPLVQRWVIRNTGTTTWTRDAGYALRFVTGEDLGRPDPIPIPEAEVAPERQVTLELPVVAPAAAGTHRGIWRMARGSEGVFGDEASLEVRVAADAGRAACHSRTLDRDVPDGSCVQVDYPGCGARSCGWYACHDGRWVCADVATCAGERFGHERCVDATCAERAPCGGCTTTPGCGWCGDRCVPEAEGRCSPIQTDPASCEGCRAAGAVCDVDADCCGAGDGGAMRCILGFCTDTTGCGRVGAGCAGRDDCCGQIVCAASPTGDRACCLRDTDPCSRDGDCCGAMTCDEGRCACRERGERCASITDCCGGMICDDGVCGF